MGYDKKMDGKKGVNPMRGAARRTYPGPRVGAVRGDVPRAERVGAEDEGRAYGSERRSYGGNREFTPERRAHGAGNHRPYDAGYVKKARGYGAEKRFSEQESAPENRESAHENRPYGGDRYYSGDPKRRREEEKRREAPSARRAEPEETPATLEVDPEQIICGRNPIREALRAGRPIEKLLAASELSGSAREIVKMARDAGAVVQIVDRARLDQIYPAHQGLLAYLSLIHI